MKIIVLGAGQVGTSVAANLCNESNDITVVDSNQSTLNSLQDRFDLRTVNGIGSSPNTLDLRKLSSTDYIEDLTREINLKKEKLEKKYSKKVPLFLKLSPDEKEENLQKIISTSLSNNFSGFIVSNTMKGNSKGISGGISGDLLKNKSCEILRKVQGLVGNEVILIASGGISTKVDVEERLDNGAKLIQIYTSFVYRGPTIVNELLN